MKNEKIARSLSKMLLNNKYGKYAKHVLETEKHYDVASLYPEYMNVEKIEFPIENVKEIVEQIVLLNREINNGHYSTEITETLNILNDSLKRLLNPSIIISGEENV